jgi:Zn-dependent peptidase ImmA (M78 family)
MRGLSLRQLAGQLTPAVSYNALHKYELGAMMPDSAVLLSLCRALGQKPDFFLRPQTVELECVEFRKRASLSTAQVTALREKANDFFERYLEIETLLGVRNEFASPLADFEIHEAADVEQAAVRLRNAWHLGRDPLPSVVSLLEDRGIMVYAADAPEGFEGFAGHAGKTPVMVLSGNRPADRLRLTALHELGHLVLRFHAARFNAKEREHLCHRFAGAMLIPEEEFTQAFGGHRSKISTAELVAMKVRFGVSCQAIIMRARDLELISGSTLKRFFILWRKWNYQVMEPGAWSGDEKVSRFAALVYRAAANEEVSLTKAAYLMGRSLAEFQREFAVVE